MAFLCGFVCGLVAGIAGLCVYSWAFVMNDGP